MFGFIKKVFIATMTFFSFNGIAFNILSVNFLRCILMNNQEWKAGPKIIDVNNNEPVFFCF